MKAQALILRTATATASVEAIDIEEPGPGEVQIRVRAVALNPVDEIFVSSPVANQDRRIVGTDFAGVVVKAHSELNSLADVRVKPGTRVAGFLQGGLFSIFFSHVLKSCF